MNLRTITTVTTPAEAYGLVALGDVKTVLQIASGNTSNDTLLTELILEASASIAIFCNYPADSTGTRTLLQQSYLDTIFIGRDFYPYQLPGGVDPLQLSCYPIVDLVSVAENTWTLPTTDYILDPRRGQLTRLDYSGMPRLWHPGVYQIAFAGGFATVPADLADAVKRIVKAKFYSLSTNDNLKQESIPGVIERQYWVSDKGDPDGEWTPDIVDIVSRYRVPNSG